jgi:hypothetical protein
MAKFTAGTAPKPPARTRVKSEEPPRVFDDDDLWGKLAHDRGVRLPQHATPLTTGGMTQWLKKLGIPIKEYTEYVGGWPLKKCVDVWSAHEFNMRACVGHMLEYLEYIRA